MAFITICAILKAKPGQVNLLRNVLQNLIEPSRAEKGCIEYRLHESLHEKGTFVFYETWANEEAAKSHNETNHYKEYRQMVENLIDTRDVYRLGTI